MSRECPHFSDIYCDCARVGRGEASLFERMKSILDRWILTPEDQARQVYEQLLMRLKQ